MNERKAMRKRATAFSGSVIAGNTHIPEIEVVAAVLHEGEKIFAVQRGRGEFKGCWEFPGGKVEKGEGREAALRRELKEELQAEIIIEKHLQDVFYTYPHFYLRMHVFLCRLDHSVPVLTEHSQARWLSFPEWFTVEWLPADIQVLESLRDTFFEEGLLAAYLE